MAQRLGRPHETQAHLRAALALDAGDQYLLGAYADFLLENGRYREAATLMQPHLRNDGLLLRYAEALSALHDPQAAGALADLGARFDAARRRGGRVHLRDEARFALHLRHQPEEALVSARENWKVQKEPADLRILAQAAHAARAERDLAAVHGWVHATGYEDAMLARLLSAREAP
jgi:hypothetical protein